jgi:pimeloyl-ACP methyl ester carboxylesterase
MNHRPLHSRRRVLAASVAAVLSALALGTTSSTAAAGPDAQRQVTTSDGPHKPGDKRGGKPTIVLVHGAFADSSGWNAVAARLLDAGYPVVAFSNPLRGPLSDASYLRDFLGTIAGSVVLVGHSYGGAVITNAATGDPDVRSLVYVAAYALDEGESVADANALGGGHTEVTDHLVLRPFPGASQGDADAYIDPAHFRRLFAQDLPSRTTRLMAATQRPGALAALVTPSGPPAWETVPSWYLVAKQDRIIPPQAERAMAQRAGSTTVAINSSHVAMMSHPGVVAKLIRDAAKG